MQDPSAVARHRQVNETSWRSTALTDAWRRWTPKQTVLLEQATNAILRASQVARGMQVLDLASGPGNPALQLAEAVGPQGCVTATDVIADMVASVEANAARAGVTNMRFRQADAHALPFEAATFDVVTCRFGIMYFSNVAQALREVHRVCKPEGRVAFVSWGHEEQPFFASTHGIVAKHMRVPLRPDAPNTFAFARPGSLGAALAGAGFDRIEEEALAIEMIWPGPAAELWQFFQEVTASFAEMKRNLPDDWERISGEAEAALSAHARDGRVHLPGLINVASGRAPATPRGPREGT
jgi:ubiquinone/menaquinone biosynthesis C-methylase UbiE